MMNELLQIRMLGVFSFGIDLGWALLMIPLLPLLGFLVLGLFLGLMVGVAFALVRAARKERAAI